MTNGPEGQAPEAYYHLSAFPLCSARNNRRFRTDSKAPLPLTLTTNAHQILKTWSEANSKRKGLFLLQNIYSAGLCTQRASSMFTTKITLSFFRIFRSSHIMGGWNEGYVIGCNLPPHHWMPLNPKKKCSFWRNSWTFRLIHLFINS